MRNITECQKRLIALGFPCGPNGADGRFGQDTLDAYNRFRASQGRKPVKLPSMSELNADLFPEEQPAPKPKPTNPRKENPMETVLANVKSAWLSKLNWTLVAGALFNLFAFFGLNVPNDVKDAIVMVGNGAVLIVAWVIKTWFTTAISSASAKKL